MPAAAFSILLPLCVLLHVLEDDICSGLKRIKLLSWFVQPEFALGWSSKFPMPNLYMSVGPELQCYALQCEFALHQGFSPALDTVRLSQARGDLRFCVVCVLDQSCTRAL